MDPLQSTDSDLISQQAYESLLSALTQNELQHLEQNTFLNVNPLECESLTATGNLPSTEEFPGPFNFKIDLNGNNNTKNSWVFSDLLDRVFIDMNKVLLVKFHVDVAEPGMFIRALPMFSETDYKSVPVIRCSVHAIEDDPTSAAHAHEGKCYCNEHRLAGHVVRVFSLDAMYCYDALSERHSVKVPLITPHPGSDFMDVPYTFTCKTSCPRGMQRRPIHVVFTLETSSGDVLGRKTVAVKICSCPKRDCTKQERSLAPPPSKKLKTSPDNHQTQQQLNSHHHELVNHHHNHNRPLIPQNQLDDLKSLLRQNIVKLQQIEAILRSYEQ